MLTTSSCRRAFCARGFVVLTFALSLGLALTSYAQNSAVYFTSSQSIPLPNINNGQFDLTHADAVPEYVGCSNVFAGKFHSSSKMDFMGTCQPQPNDVQTLNAALINQGNGLFNSVEDTAADTAYEVVALTADLNEDGFDDLVLVGTEDLSHSGFGVQLSNGNGTFKAPVYYTPSCASVVAGDFEDNGRIDIACFASNNGDTDGGKNTLTIFLNDGSGKFTQSASLTLPSTAVGDQNPILVAGDLNGDHKVDLAVVYRHSSGTVIPLISQGNGKFTQGGTYNAGSSPSAAVIGNFNDDPYGDIAVTTSTGVNVLLGNSRGTFSSPISTPYPTTVTYGTGAQIVAADFDKDGKLDVALTTQDNVYIFWGAGTGAFPAYSVYSIPSGSDALVSADINDDGRQDLAVGGSNGSINILYNTGGRTFGAAPNTHASPSAGIVAGNFTGRGKKDLAVVNPPSCAAPCSGTVTILPDEGSYFGAGKTYAIGMHGQAIAAGDINGDGVPDLVVTNATPGDSADTSILLGIKGGGFHSAHNITLGSLSNNAFLVDMNGDGKLDLVEDGGVALGDGKGDFGSLTPFPAGIGFSQGPLIAVADFNGDGHPDVVALFGQQQADILINNGKGDFTASPLNAYEDNILDEFGPSGVTAGPLKPGGPNDIVVTGILIGDNVVFYDAVTYIFTNDGKGNFQLGSSSPGFSVGPVGSGGPATIADFNHDGFPDIGFSAGDQFFISTGPNFNSPRLAFATTSSLAYVGFPKPYLAVADFNGDGWPDVAFNNAYDGVARLYDVPVPTVTPGSLTFSSTGVRTVSIKNTVKTKQAITAGLVPQGTTPTGGQSPFKISSNTCGTLGVGASCSISVEYTGATTGSTGLYISANGQFIAAIPISGS